MPRAASHYEALPRPQPAPQASPQGSCRAMPHLHRQLRHLADVVVPLLHAQARKAQRRLPAAAVLLGEVNRHLERRGSRGPRAGRRCRREPAGVGNQPAAGGSSRRAAAAAGGAPRGQLRRPLPVHNTPLCPAAAGGPKQLAPTLCRISRLLPHSVPNRLPLPSMTMKPYLQEGSGAQAVWGLPSGSATGCSPAAAVCCQNRRCQQRSPAVEGSVCPSASALASVQAQRSALAPQPPCPPHLLSASSSSFRASVWNLLSQR